MAKDGAAARAYVGDGQWCRQIANKLQGVLHQQLGFGPGDEDAGPDHEVQVVKLTAAKNVGQGFALGAAGNQFTKASQLLGRQRPVRMGKNRGPVVRCI